MGKHVGNFITTTKRCTEALCSIRPGYIAGVTNPIFESTGSWDLLCDIGNNRMVVHQNIFSSYPLSTLPPPPGTIVPRSGTLKAESSIGSEDDIGRVPMQSREVQALKGEIAGKADSADNVFMEDVSTRISCLPPSLTSEIDNNSYIVPFW